MKKIVFLLLTAAMLLSVTVCGAAAADSESTTALDFEEATVVDNDQCLIKITGIEVGDETGSYYLETYMENKSADTKYQFDCNVIAVNGLAVYGFTDDGTVKIAAGKNASEVITVYSEDIALLDQPTDISVYYDVYESVSVLANELPEDAAYGTTHIYPYGEDQATVYVRESRDTDITLMDNDQITVIATGCGEDELGYYTVSLYIVNKTDTALVIDFDDMTVNGTMLPGLDDLAYSTYSIEAGTSGYYDVSIWPEDLEDAGITDIADIVMTLNVYDSEEYNDAFTEDGLFTGTPLCSETATLNP